MMALASLIASLSQVLIQAGAVAVEEACASALTRKTLTLLGRKARRTSATRTVEGVAEGVEVEVVAVVTDSHIGVEVGTRTEVGTRVTKAAEVSIVEADAVIEEGTTKDGNGEEVVEVATEEVTSGLRVTLLLMKLGVNSSRRHKLLSCD